MQLEPTDIEDIIVMISLYRPGPMEFIANYIAGKNGTKTITYLHPKLKPILERTYGIAVYQEQIMEIARQLASFSYAEADVLRKAVGKKIKSLLVKQEEKMIAGMVKNGVNEKIAKKIWEYILPFARYGFNRAHAASYAMIAYQTAYLKANYPTQFMAALMTSDEQDTDRIAIEISEAERMGIEVLPPDINESYTIFTVVVSQETVKKPRIRFGLKAIKNVGEHIAKVIIHERKTDGPYKNLEDFLLRVRDKDLNKKSLESLIKSGSLDRFGKREDLLENIDRLLKFGKKTNPTNQQGLFGNGTASLTPSLTLEPAEPIAQQQKLIWEKQLLGVYLSAHPMKDVQSLLPKDLTPLRELNRLPRNGQVRVAGIITKIQKVITRKGDPMLFVTIEDGTGNVEVLVFANILELSRADWQEDKIVAIAGKISDKDGVPKIICDKVKRIEIV